MKPIDSSFHHTIQFLFKQLKGHRLQITLNIIIGVLFVFIDLGFVWVTKLAVDIATHNSHVATLQQAFILMASIMLLRILLSICSRWIRAVLGVKAQNNMRIHLFARLLNSKWNAVRNFHTGNLTNRIEKDVTDVVNFITESIPSLVTTIVQFLGAFFFLFYMDSMLAVIIVCIIPFFILSSKIYVKRMKRLTHAIRGQESNIQSLIQETLQHNILVKTLDCFHTLTDNLHAQQTALHEKVIHRTKYSTVSTTLLSIGFATGYFVTFAWGATQLSNNLISYGAMLAFVQLVSQIQNPVRNMSRFVPIFINAFTATERLIELDTIEQEQTVKNRVILSIATSICFENISFRYTPTSRFIFEQSNFKIPANGVTVITGETGTGKTTLIRLLLAIVEPTTGNINLECKDGKMYTVNSSLRNNFAYVPQGNSLISGSIKYNILLGNPNASDEDIRKALHTAGADFVLQKETGLETICGETGDGLSEGQAQRIAIARALVSNKMIFIFDEATSSLDNETEKIVLERIAQNYKDRTLIFITHRGEVLKYANQIIHLQRMNSGVLVQSSTKP